MSGYTSGHLEFLNTKSEINPDSTEAQQNSHFFLIIFINQKIQLIKSHFFPTKFMLQQCTSFFYELNLTQNQTST